MRYVFWEEMFMGCFSIQINHPYQYSNIYQLSGTAIGHYLAECIIKTLS